MVEKGDIAVIGMSGRFPGAADIDEFWDNLVSGKSSVSEVDKGRWNADEYYDANPSAQNKSISKWGGFLDHIDMFDPMFFRILPIDAHLMDPQQRLFLQESWKALEDAGYTRKSLANKKCGVFVGASGSDYAFLIRGRNVAIGSSAVSSNILSGIVGRTSYFFNFDGPGLCVDTACSSGLSAVHFACENIRTNKLDMAIAGGVNIWSTVEPYLAFSKSGILSPSSQCKSFDISANGLIPAEAVAVLILKSLERAIEDRDHIYGVIKGSQVLQNGMNQSSYLLPSFEAQAKLMADVYETYAIDIDTISHIELQGSGTQLGDRAELKAVQQVFSRRRSDRPCSVSTSESNFGHAFAASGIVNLIKVLLSMKHKKLPKVLHFDQTHDDVKSDAFYINTTLRSWDQDFRRAAVNSFGFTGINCHLVVDEYVPPAPLGTTFSAQSFDNYIIPISAKDKNRLKEYLVKFVQFLKHKQWISMEDLSYTLLTGREYMPERVAFVVRDKQMLLDKIAFYLSGIEDSHTYCGHTKEKSSSYSKDALLAIASSENFDQIASLWAKGYFEEGEIRVKSRSRISLPTYSFAAQRYWVPEGKAETPIAVVKPLADNQASKENETFDIRREFLKIVSKNLDINEANINLDEDVRTFGVDSLRLIAIAAEIGGICKIKFEPSMIFEFSTFREIVNYLEDYLKDPTHTFENKKIFPLKRNSYPISNNQYYYYKHIQEHTYSTWNNGVQLHLFGAVDGNCLAEAIRMILIRHEVLRTFFKENEGEITQEIKNNLDHQMERIDLSNYNIAEQNKLLNNLLSREGAFRFDINQYPLFRFCFIKLAVDRFVLTTVFSHLVMDGYSLPIFFNELASNYKHLLLHNKPCFESLPYQYGDWALATRSEKPSWEKQNFWKNKIQNRPPFTTILPDFFSADDTDWLAETKSVYFSLELRARIDEFCKMNQNIPRISFYIAVFNLVLFHETKNQDILFDSLYLGREKEDAEKLSA